MKTPKHSPDDSKILYWRAGTKELNESYWRARPWENRLVGINLRRANFEGADLSNAFLLQADLRKVNLSRANLRGAILREADLSQANLHKVNLRLSNLSSANLRQC